jgi:hypothetical protein
MGRLSTKLAVPLAALALLSTGAAAVAATPAKKSSEPAKLTLISPSAQPATINVAQVSDTAAAGRLTLLVKSSAAGKLGLRFIVAKTGAVADTERADRTSPPLERPVVFEKAGNLKMLKDQTRLVRIQFVIAPEAQADLLDGVLIIRLTNSKPTKASRIVIATKGQRDTAAAGGAVSPQPLNPSLIVTSWAPFGHWWVFGEHQTVLIPAKVDEVVNRKYVVILGSDSGGLLRATLKRDGSEASSNGLTPTKLVVDHVGRAGSKYTGDVVLGPAAGDKLGVTVHVRDFFLWPFLALLAGAGIGGFGIRRWEQRRRRALLIKRVKDAYGTFESTSKTRPPNDRPPPLDPDPGSRRDGLIAAINKAESDDDYNDQVDAVSAYESELRRWLRLATAADALVVLERDLPRAAVLARDDAGIVLATLNLELDASEADRVAEEAERLAEILSIFVPVWSLWVQRGMPEELNPLTSYVSGAFRTEPHSLELRAQLEELRDLLNQLPVPEPSVEAFGITAFAREGTRLETIFAIGGLPLPWKPFDQLAPQAIEHRVRMYDWAVGTASLLVTLLAFLLTKYGQDYGTLSDYAQAFTAGFLGQLAGATIAWNLFPPFRSYRATRTDAAAPATA